MKRSKFLLVYVFTVAFVNFTPVRAQNTLDYLADVLFDSAEWQYPEIFPSAELTQSLIGGTSEEGWSWRWLYRYYAASDTYLAVNEKDFTVYVYGPYFGPEIIPVGNLIEVLKLVGAEVEDPLGISGVWLFQLTHYANPASIECGYPFHQWLSGSYLIEIYYDSESGKYVPNLGELLSSSDPVDGWTWGFDISDNDEGLQTDASFSLTVHSPQFMTGSMILDWDYADWGNCNGLIWIVTAVKQ